MNVARVIGEDPTIGRYYTPRRGAVICLRSFNGERLQLNRYGTSWSEERIVKFHPDGNP